MAKPTTLTPWATTLAAYPISGLNNRVQPPVGWQTDGWDENEEPAPNYENYRAWEAYTWRKWFDEATARPATVTVASVTVAADTHADYICDGEGDQVQIQLAVNTAAAAGGGTVLLSAGVFTVDAAITIVADKVQIVGCGAGTIIQVAAAAVTDFNVITLSATTNSSVINLAIDGNAGVHGHFHSGIVVTGASAGTVVERVFFRNMQADGAPDEAYGYGIFGLGTAARTTINRCSAYACAQAGYAIAATGTLPGTMISNSFARSCGLGGSAAAGSGIVMTGDGGIISGNYVKDCGWGGIQIGVAGSAAGNSITCHDNIIHSTTNAPGLYAYGEYNDLHDNHVYTSGTHGIHLQAFDYGKCHHNEVSTNVGHGIFVDNCHDSQVTDNTIGDSSHLAANAYSNIHISLGERTDCHGNKFFSRGLPLVKTHIEGDGGAGSGHALVYGNDCRANSMGAKILDNFGDFVSLPTYAWDGSAWRQDTAAMGLVNRIA